MAEFHYRLGGGVKYLLPATTYEEYDDSITGAIIEIEPKDAARFLALMDKAAELKDEFGIYCITLFDDTPSFYNASWEKLLDEEEFDFYDAQNPVKFSLKLFEYLGVPERTESITLDVRPDDIVWKAYIWKAGIMVETIRLSRDRLHSIMEREG
jgi:hypothetical protein